MRQFPLICAATRTFAAVVGIGLGAWACSAASEGERLEATPGKGTATGGTRPMLELGVGGSSTSGGQTGSAVCNAQVRDGQRVPVDMYFLVDSSGSMGESVAGGTKWEVASGALMAFLNDPRNTGMGVGIGYFPDGAPGSCMLGEPNCLCIPFINVCFSTEGGSCQISDYSTPAVPLALPPPLLAVVDDIAQHAIGGGTPTRPAVEGALEYLSGWAAAHPERKSVLVLATDGEPSGCDTNTPQDVADVAAAALAGPYAIRTFVIGVGNSLSSLNLIAQAGGTDRAFLVDTGGDVAKEFADALDQIRGAASACDFSIPDTGADGAPVNPSQVNVSYTPTGSSSPTLVPQTFMGDPNNCDATGGWYYDDPQSPSAIKLCDATCRALSGSSIQVEFGCDTVMRQPH